MQPNGKPSVRQGDVLLIPTDDMPTNLTLVPASDGRLIIAEGEATGHHHAITLTAETDAEFYTVADEVDRWLRVRAPSVPLTHPEHGTIPLTERGYIVRYQREYAPEAIRRVVD